MERRRMIYLIFLVAFALVLSSCHPRHLSDIKQNMTKQEVARLWGRTPLISDRTVEGKSVETWEYHFSRSDSVCLVTFSEDKVAATECRPEQRGTYFSYSQPGQSNAGPPPSRQNLVREGAFAWELAGLLGIEAESEAEAESKLASVGIAPKNGWIADFPVTPFIIEELQHAAGEAADSGKIAMKREEAVKAIQNLMTKMGDQSA
jgi:hypothetical protein